MSTSPTDRRIGLIGLGLMGTAIADRLLASGYTPVLWNRTPEKATPFLERGALWSDNPLAECRRIIVSLYSSEVVAEVLAPRVSAIRSGQIVVDTTTGDPEQSEVWDSQFAIQGACYLDAPISGSSEQTRRGEATVIVSGDRTAYEACHDLWPVLGGQVFHVGRSGNAARMKLVTNLVLGLNRAALAEGLVFADGLGLDGETTLQVLRGSPAYSRQMDSKGRKMLDRDYTPQARLSQHLKDVRLILQAAASQGLPLPLSTAHRQLLQVAEMLGWGDQDNSAVVEAVRGAAR